MSALSNSFMIRSLAFIAVILSAMCSHAQEKYYFDKDWIHCNESDAKYFRIIEEVDTLLKVTDYYMSGSKQFEGFVLKEPNTVEILKIRGDFEQKKIGDSKYFKKNGKLDYTTNEFPFDPEHGIDSIYFELLNSVDNVNIDSSQLVFAMYYFKNTMGYHFVLDDDRIHGTEMYVLTKTNTVLNRSLYSKGILEGVSLTFWKNGNIKEAAPYKNGDYHGEVKRYNRKGVLKKGKEYVNGVLIETWLYKKPKKKS
jgi:antitoxin component YwqK of YwqJK toxin-antitoxin module